MFDIEPFISCANIEKIGLWHCLKQLNAYLQLALYRLQRLNKWSKKLKSTIKACKFFRVLLL